jgi:toxin ParE1/3/4
MAYRYNRDAEQELVGALRFYETQEQGLGERFLDAVDRAIVNIVEFPQAWPVIEEDVRKCLLVGFPYAILYFMEEETIEILAVMHLKRKPNYWRERK